MIDRRSIADLVVGDVLLDFDGRELGAFISSEQAGRDPYAPWAGQRLVVVTVMPEPPSQPYPIRFASFGDVVSILPAEVES
jgi:hypothetical protein